MSLLATKFLPFHQAFIGEEEIRSVAEVMRSGWLTSGPRAKEFEACFARFVGAEHAVAVNSCTAALHLALAAIGLQEGEEVILPTMTFAASAEVVLYFKARPVLVDCINGSFHMDPAEIERAVTSRTRAVVPVHYGGYPCEMDSILEIARRNKMKVIEDAAHAMPSRYKGKMIGAIGDITCFSFYATKTLTTGEGGMATTENQEYAERMRRLSLHGISKDAWKRYTAEGSWKYDIAEAGYKYNLPDLQAAIGLVQLGKCHAMQARRREIAEQYTEELETLEGFTAPATASDEGHAWHLYVVHVNSAALRIRRDQVIEELKNRGIGTSVHFIPLHLHSLYQRHLGYREGQFPNAEERFSGAISLPLYPGMDDADVGRVIEALRDVNREFIR
ncbi:MAG TPA: DegT/DnrJ/EryC1/StrS family aminotransferase [Candidatus Acidoferrum sp.]|nr:DegT/DnrJ/EryC1/StrS family aminotransferase [Candidatus Acidoferrum sp.]